MAMECPPGGMLGVPRRRHTMGRVHGGMHGGDARGRRGVDGRPTATTPATRACSSSSLFSACLGGAVGFVLGARRTERGFRLMFWRRGDARPTWMVVEGAARRGPSSWPYLPRISPAPASSRTRAPSHRREFRRGRRHRRIAVRMEGPLTRPRARPRRARPPRPDPACPPTCRAP